jgi:DNA topoisomerase-3
MQRFADGHGCRMVELVRHFGDQEDTGQRCGLCDACDAAACVVRTARAPKPREREAAEAIFQALRERDGQATGRLHTACASTGLERRDFEEVLGGLARAGLLKVTADTFAKDGRDISFKRAFILPAARTAASTAAIEFTLSGDSGDGASGGGAGRGRGKGKGTTGKPARRAPEADAGLVAMLKQWRLLESRRNGLPAFRVLTDRTLTGIAAARPQDEAGLLAVSGFGPALLRRYGQRLLSLCQGSQTEPPPSRPAGPPRG